MSVATGPLVEILLFEGCPNREGAVELVGRVASSLGLQPTVHLVSVESPEEATRLRFLGSPSVRVGGRDVEPGADDRQDFVLACRLYRTDVGSSGQPAEEWVRAALLEAAE